MGDSIEDGVFGDFVKHDTLRLDVFQTAFRFEDFQKMPRNSFTFPIRVGGEVDVFGFFGSGDDGIDVFAVAADELVFHRKAVAGIDRAAFGDEGRGRVRRMQGFQNRRPNIFSGFWLWTGIRRLIGFSPFVVLWMVVLMPAFQTAFGLPSEAASVHRGFVVE